MTINHLPAEFADERDLLSTSDIILTVVRELWPEASRFDIDAVSDSVYAQGWWHLVWPEEFEAVATSTRYAIADIQHLSSYPTAA